MDISTIITFMVSTALIVAIPGPTVLMIVAAGVAGGRRAALGALFAILAADLLLIALVAGSLGAIAELGGTAMNWLTAIGAFVLLLLGLRMVRDDRDGIHSRVSVPAYSIGSFVATVVNPKSLIFFAAFLPQFVDPSSPAMPQHLMLMVLFLLAATPVALGYALGAVWLADRNGPLGHISALAPRLAGLCLIGLGAVGMARVVF